MDKKETAQENKALKKEIEDTVKSTEDQINDAIEQGETAQKKKALKKKHLKLGGAGAVVAILGYFIYGLFQPYQGSMAYGMCKVFLEQNVTYPTTLQINQVEELNNWVRLWHTQIDGFGAYRMEPIQCYFRPDPVTKSALDKVYLGDPARKREVDPKKVEEFNQSIPYLLDNPPDLTLPARLPDNLRNLKFDRNRFVKPIL